MAAAKATIRLMPSLGVRASKLVYPTGDKSFSVKQSFPSGFTAEEADPFLMCDHFGPMRSHAVFTGDAYPVSWHPHRGFDLLTYMVEGVGRHADSMGNRGTFDAPGMQWISAGSGIEHAEAGGTPVGENTLGFQIWINVPSAKKMDDPRYGTNGPADIPPLPLAPGVTARVLAGPVPGSLSGARGPFVTTQSVSIIDVVVAPGARLLELTIAPEHNNALVYCYRGRGAVSGVTLDSAHTIRLDASLPTARALSLEAAVDDTDGMHVLVFSGTRLEQPIAWHGPIVMTNQDELQTAFRELRAGTFLKKRAPFDYRVAAAAPSDWDWHNPQPVAMKY